MNLTTVFTAFTDMIASVVVTVRQHTAFTAFGFSSSWIDLVFAVIALYMVVSMFWKGARG